MHASCGSPLHLLSVFGPGALVTFGDGEEFSTSTTVGGGGDSITVDVAGDVIEPIGTCSAGLEAQLVTANTATAPNDKRKFITIFSTTQSDVKGRNPQLHPGCHWHGQRSESCAAEAAKKKSARIWPSVLATKTVAML
jgi:hypothetical protein